MAGHPVPTSNVLDTPKLMQALNSLLNIVGGYITAQAFLAACELNLFEELSHGPISSEELAGRVKIHPVACRRLLMALAHMGLVERDGDAYRNSELGQFCSSKSAVNLASLAGYGSPFYRMFEYLPDALREYSPRWQQALGAPSEDVFGALYADPTRLRQFARFMNALSIPQGQLIAECFDFGPYECVMDVAGGPGGQAIQIGLKHSHLHGIITDMEPVCAIAREYIQASGLANRFKAVATDLFEGAYPKGADVVLLGHVLHDWSDENCHKILRNCAAALPVGGVLLVSESVLEPDFSGSTAAHLKDLTMVVACEPGARERTATEYRSLLNEAGFDLTDIIRLDAPRDLIVSRKR